MRVYIRHADKEYSNGDSETHKHDPGILIDSPEYCCKKASELIKRYGIPFVIVCSPYKRTRETAIEMVDFIQNTYATTVRIRVDVQLSEYLGNRRDENLDVTTQTRKFNPPHPETFHEMDSRVRWHNDIFRKLDSFPEVVWFITHGFIINRIGNAMGFKLPHRISYLSTAAFGPTNKCEFSNGPNWSTLYRE